MWDVYLALTFIPNIMRSDPWMPVTTRAIFKLIFTNFAHFKSSYYEDNTVQKFIMLPSSWSCSSYRITIMNAYKIGTRLFCSSSLGLVTLISAGQIQDGCTVIKVYSIVTFCPLVHAWLDVILIKMLHFVQHAVSQAHGMEHPDTHVLIFSRLRGYVLLARC